MWDILFVRYMVFLMVFIRISAMILFNPALGRKSIPVAIKMGLSFFTALIITSTLSDTNVTFTGIPEFIFAGIKELLIGFMVSFIFQMFLSTVLVAGEVIDLQIGVGMSKIYDPQSNVSMPVSGSIFNLIFVLIFFVGNGHLTLIKIISLSFQILPPGPTIVNFEFGHFIAQLFANILILAIKLSLPIIAIEMISEIGMGVLMRSVPQINVFVVGLQLKLLIGIIIIILTLNNVTSILDSIITTMFSNIEQSLRMIS